MPTRKIGFLAVALTAGLVGACANDGSLMGSSLTTSSVDAAQQAKAAPVQPKIDPACIQLAAQIDTLRKEGVVERISQAAEGKSTSVQVKRASLAKMTELDKANAEFQAKCSNTPAPATATAPVTSQPAKSTEAPAKPAAKKTSSAKPADTAAKTAAAAPQTAAPAAPAAQATATTHTAATVPAAPAAPVVAAPATPAATAQTATTAKAASASTAQQVPSVPGISIAQ